LCIRGGNSKAFYGRAPVGEPFDVSGYRGIVAYAPSELVITARAGTPVAEIEAALAEHGQMLAFEPPHFAPGATIGGTVACGLSGPRRPYAGSVRDFVLGVQCLNGKGERLRFGGQVMKNVAGFDVSRLQTGALGTLGVLLEVSLKVLPQPAMTVTIERETSEDDAIRSFNAWAGQPLPMTAASYSAGWLRVRLAGAGAAVEAAHKTMAGKRVEEGDDWWRGLRDHSLPFFTDPRRLWRLSLPPATRALTVEGDTLIDWGGAQRWLKSTLPPQVIDALTREAGGHASQFRDGDREGEVFAALSPAVQGIHQRLKSAFDPKRILNPGRLFSYL
jgi:glycolate oxidase FAD binding subunit